MVLFSFSVIPSDSRSFASNPARFTPLYDHVPYEFRCSPQPETQLETRVPFPFPVWIAGIRYAEAWFEMIAHVVEVAIQGVRGCQPGENIFTLNQSWSRKIHFSFSSKVTIAK